MITRLKVSGFKNLVDIDIRFGPFTCIAGSNAVGKSNIFDAIRFLSLLSEKSIAEAASLLRARNDSYQNKGSSVRSIFHRVGDQYNDTMSFEVEMIIPREGEDDLGQPATATFNFLKYSLELKYENPDDINKRGPIRVLKEELIPISKSKSKEHLLFEHSTNWRNSVIQGKRDVPFISTEQDEKNEILINLHQDGGSSGRPQPFVSKNLPRTVLSTANYASETPTLLLAKREMQSWRMLQLEPSSLRMPDELDKYSNRSCLGNKGEGLPSTVYRLYNYDNKNKFSPNKNIYTKLAIRLSGLIPDVKAVSVDKDEKRQLLTLQVIDKDGTQLPARSLSDGTLRFLALTVLDLDHLENGLLCLEEPENGIYPDRIPAIVELLESIAFSPFEEDDETNPLRQVIINTHSPRVVSEISDDSLIYIELKEQVKNNLRYKVAFVNALSDTWRTEKANTSQVSKGKLLSYFNLNNNSSKSNYLKINNPDTKKIKDREDLEFIFQKNYLYN